jgi:transketolase
MIQISNQEFQKYQVLAREIRKDILEMIYRTKSPHIGSSFSMVELLVALYFKILRVNPKNPEDPNRDRFLLSKGHGVPALYPVLAERGFIKKEILEDFARDGGTLEQHPTRNLSQGIEITSGSLGHGLSIGVGMALAGKYDKEDYRIFTFLSDGELEEGSSWEAIMFASHHQLDNLIAIVDYNKLQAMGKVSEIINLEPLSERWQSFGWEVREIDGHNFEEIFSTLEILPFKKGKPSCLIAHTIKGKGVSFMEGDPRWHDKYPDEEEYKKALAELQ